jgi:hypothetical protein
VSALSTRLSLLVRSGHRVDVTASGVIRQRPEAHGDCFHDLGALRSGDSFGDIAIAPIELCARRNALPDPPSSGRDRLRWPGRGMSWTVVVARRRLNVTALVNDRAASRARRAWRLRAAVPGGLP